MRGITRYNEYRTIDDNRTDSIDTGYLRFKISVKIRSFRKNNIVEIKLSIEKSQIYNYAAVLFIPQCLPIDRYFVFK